MRRLFGQTANTPGAVNLLRKYYAALPQPQGDLALAKAFAAAGDPVSAAVYAQRVYYKLSGCERGLRRPTRWRRVWSRNWEISIRHAMGDAMLWDVR